MSLRPTQPNRGHDAGSHNAVQAVQAPVVTAAAAPQGPHVSAVSGGQQASGSTGASATITGAGNRKRE